MATSPRALRGYERVILIAISLLGVGYLALTANFTWVSLRQKLVDGIYSIKLGLNGDQLPLISPPTAGTATVTEVRISEAWANVTDLSDSTISLLIAQHVAGFLLLATIISSAIYLCLRLLKGKPFARSMTIVAVVCALALIILGTGTDYLGEVLRNTIQTEALGEGIPPEPFSGSRVWNFPGGYLITGLAVAAVALAFRIGDRVTRDTEGLV